MEKIKHYSVIKYHTQTNMKTQAAKMNINWYLEKLGNKFRKLTLHSENPKHPKMIWQATPNQHTSKWKQGVRGETPEEALENLCCKVLGSTDY